MAELMFDSTQQAEPALTRGTTTVAGSWCSPPSCRSVEIEVLSDRVVGQFLPPSSGEVVVEGDEGVVATVPVDDLGFFVIDAGADRGGPAPLHDAVHPAGHRLGAPVTDVRLRGR